MEGMKAEHRRVIPCLLFLEKEAGQNNLQKKIIFLNVIH
jgi:hypothetical protein